MDASRSDDEPSIKKQYLFPCYTDFPFHSPSKSQISIASFILHLYLTCHFISYQSG